MILRAGGTLRVYESGSLKGSFGTFVSGDEVSVTRSGSTVTYEKNGTAFYTSTLTSTGNLIADVAIYHRGGTVTRAKIMVK